MFGDGNGYMLFLSGTKKKNQRDSKSPAILLDTLSPVLMSALAIAVSVFVLAEGRGGKRRKTLGG